MSHLFLKFNALTEPDLKKLSLEEKWYEINIFYGLPKDSCIYLG